MKAVKSKDLDIEVGIWQNLKGKSRNPCELEMEGVLWSTVLSKMGGFKNQVRLLELWL